jgi:hypothetical protein
MRVIEARNVNDAWPQAKALLNGYHLVRPSRAGEVWECPEAVTTLYRHPRERVLFDPRRDANPFFHLFEALWMLDGRNDVAFVASVLPRMQEFSDDGITYHGAYGYRWRVHFGRDQLMDIKDMLMGNHDDRRAVLTMWDPRTDLNNPSCKDLPCNDVVFFKVREGRLNMTVCCRSNDICWGCYGANCVHMSMLQEFMAAQIGVPVGVYWQVSDSWHAYTERWAKFGGLDSCHTGSDYYQVGHKVSPFQLVRNPDAFTGDLANWLSEGRGSQTVGDFLNPFFPLVASPLWRAHEAYKQGDLEAAIIYAHSCAAEDWRLAAVQWLERRKARRAAKTEGDNAAQ